MRRASVVRAILVALAAIALLVAFVPMALAQDGGGGRTDFASIIAERGLLWGILIAFGAGILVSFTPCVYPMIPITVGIIGARGDKATVGRSFGLAFTYVFGLVIAYSVLGLLVGLIGPQVRTFLMSPYVVGAVAIVFVLLALGMFGLYELQLPSSVATRLSAVGGKGFVGVLLMGMVSGLVASPCTAAPLAGILAFVATQGDPIAGFAMLFAFAWGMGLLLLVVGTSAGALSRLPRSGAWMMDFKYLFGFIFLAAAAYFARTLLPELAYFLIVAACLIGGGIAFGALDSLPPNPGAGLRAKRGIAVLIMLLGLYVLLGTLWTRGVFLPERPHGTAVPIVGPVAGTPVAAAPEIEWETDIDAAFARAEAESKPVFIDWTAEWCEICKEVEREAFPRADIRGTMARYVPLRVDGTELDEREKQLAEQYDYLAPPTFIVASPTGDLVGRREGYEGADELLAFLEEPGGGPLGQPPGGT